MGPKAEVSEARVKVDAAFVAMRADAAAQTDIGKDACTAWRRVSSRQESCKRRVVEDRLAPLPWLVYLVMDAKMVIQAFGWIAKRAILFDGDFFHHTVHTQTHRE